MPFSFDPRQLPGGPAYDEKGRRPFRGVKRYGDLGRVTPGDELENTRDHERLWMYLHQTREKARAANEAAKDAEQGAVLATSPGGFVPSDIWKAAVRFASGGAYSTGDTIPNASFKVITSAPLKVGRIKANYKAGYILQMKWFAIGARICAGDIVFFNDTTGLNGYGLFDIPFDGYYEAWGGPRYTGSNWDPGFDYGAWQSPWRSFKGPAIQEAYLASDEDEYTAYFQAANCSGFSDGDLLTGEISARWVHYTALGFSLASAINSKTPTATSIPIGDNATSSGLTWNPGTQAWELSTGLPDHLVDTVDAHDASAVSVLDTGARYVAIEVEAALQELRAPVTKRSELWVNFTTGGNNIPQMPNSSSSEVIMMWAIPDDYVEGTDVTVYWRMSNSVGSNVMVINRYVYRYRSGVADLVIDNAVSNNVTLANTDPLDRSFTLAAANIDRGDTILLDLNRLGADAGDTNTGNGEVKGVWSTYTKQP